MTRKKLAEQSELSVQFVAEIETGKKSMTTNSLYKMAKALNLSADYIVFGEEAEAGKAKIESMLGSLSQKDRELAESILETFIKAVKDNR